jgi:uridine kinase
MNNNSARNPILFIGVTGGTASGKTAFVEKLVKKLHKKENINVFCISQDSFYKSLSPEQSQMAVDGNYDFDHPDAIEWSLLFEILTTFQHCDGQPEISIPIYDFIEHQRVREELYTMENVSVVIVEGILLFHHEHIRKIFDLAIFCDVDSDTRLIRRIRRDMNERERCLTSILDQYERFVKPAFDKYIEPVKMHTDVIIPNRTWNKTALSMVQSFIENRES